MGMGVEEIFRSRLRKLFYENIYIELTLYLYKNFQGQLNNVDKTIGLCFFNILTFLTLRERNVYIVRVAVVLVVVLMSNNSISY